MKTEKVRLSVKRVTSAIEDELYLAIYSLHLEGKESDVEVLIEKLKTTLEGVCNEQDA